MTNTLFTTNVLLSIIAVISTNWIPMSRTIPLPGSGADTNTVYINQIGLVSSNTLMVFEYPPGSMNTGLVSSAVLNATNYLQRTLTETNKVHTP